MGPLNCNERVRERNNSNSVLQLERQSEKLERFLSEKHSALWASWLGPKQQNTEPLAWRQRNTSLLIRPRFATQRIKESDGRLMEVCSASQNTCSYVLIIYTRSRLGCSRSCSVCERRSRGDSLDEKAGHSERPCPTLFAKVVWRVGVKGCSALGSESLNEPPIL